MNKHALLIISVSLCLLTACTQAKYQYPFQNPALSAETFSGEPVGTSEAGYVNMNPDTPLPECLKGKDSYSIRYSGEVQLDVPSTLIYVIRSNMPYSLKEVAVHKGRYQILYGSSSRDCDLKALDFNVM